MRAPWSARNAQGWRRNASRERRGDRGQRRVPALGQLVRRDQRLAHDGVVHQRQQVVLGPHVVVQRHRPRPQLLGDAAHRDRFEALAIGDVQSGRRDQLAREAGPAHSGSGRAQMGPRRARSRRRSRGRGTRRLRLPPRSESFDISLHSLPKRPWYQYSYVVRTRSTSYEQERRRRADREARQALRRAVGATRAGPGRSARDGAGPAGTQRRRQDHRAAHPHHLGRPDRGASLGGGPRRGRRGRTGPRTHRRSLAGGDRGRPAQRARQPGDGRPPLPSVAGGRPPARRRAARASRAGRRGRQAGQGPLGRHAPAPRPGRGAGRRAAGPVPGRGPPPASIPTAATSSGSCCARTSAPARPWC